MMVKLFHNNDENNDWAFTNLESSGSMEPKKVDDLQTFQFFLSMARRN